MAMVNYFLKLEGIQGESVHKGHEGAIEVLAWDWGENLAAATGPGVGAGASRVQMRPFRIAGHTSSASPQLFLACASGKHLKQAVLTAARVSASPQAFMVWTLTDVIISSYQSGAATLDEIPMDQFELSFSKIEFEYRPQKPDGSQGSPVKGGWDVKQNKHV